MTINEIIKRLQKNRKSYEEYIVEQEVMQAMDSISNAEKLVKPILELIGNNPTVDFGTPGYLVHFVEQFSGKGYEQLLMDSVIKTPTEHNIWMLHRCFNAGDSSEKDVYREVITKLKKENTTPIEVKKRIDFFNWD